MSVLLSVLEVLAPLFLLILLGFVLRRYANVLHIAHLPSLSGLVVNVTLPALVLLAITKADALPAFYARLPLSLIAAQAITITAAWAVGRLLKLPRPTIGMLIMTGTFGNTAFLGYPIVTALLPKELTAAVLMDQFGMTLPMLLAAGVLGGIFGAKSGQARRPIGPVLRRFLRSTPFLAVVIALALREIPWPESVRTAPAVLAIGGVLAKSLQFLAVATTPIALLSLGASLQPRATLASWRLLAVPCALKLVACPLLMGGFCRLMGLHGPALSVGVLQASMSTSVVCSVLCVQYEMDGPRAGGAVFATTALSLITIPVLRALTG
jgi:predicted permease